MAKKRGVLLRTILSLSLLALGFLWSCSNGDQMKKIKELESAGEIQESKKLFKEYADRSGNPNVEREFIMFLYRHEQFYDFRNAVTPYLQRHADDTEIRNLRFDYFARLARDADRVGNYEDAIKYISEHLLKPEYLDAEKWESKQTVILRKWYQAEAESGDAARQTYVLKKIKELGLDNLGRSLAPERYDSLELDQEPESD